MDGSGAMHFDCAYKTVAEWAVKHEACNHPKACAFIKARKKKGKDDHS